MAPAAEQISMRAHAQVCKVEDANIHRHDTVRDGVIPELKRHVTSVVKTEQFILELSQLDENTFNTHEARMDIIAETPQLRAMLDIRAFLSTLSIGWRSTRANENGEAQPVCNAHRRAAVYQHEALRCCGEHIWQSRSRIRRFLYCCG